MRISAEVHPAAESTIRSLHRLETGSRGVEGQIVTAVSLVESLVDQFLDILITESPVGLTPLGRRLIHRNADSFNQSWDERNGWLSGGFHIDIAGTREGQRLSTSILVRNAIIHGGGQLTDRQVKKTSAAIEGRRHVREVLNSDIQGRRIVLGSDAGTRAVTVTSEYVLALDAAVAAVRNSATKSTPH